MVSSITARIIRVLTRDATRIAAAACCGMRELGFKLMRMGAGTADSDVASFDRVSFKFDYSMRIGAETDDADSIANLKRMMPRSKMPHSRSITQQTLQT